MSTPRVYRIRPRAKLTRRLFGPVARSITFLILSFILLVTTFYSGSSASSFPMKSGSSRPESSAQDAVAKLPGFTAVFLLAPQLLEPETITTYAADCVTPKSDFHFGDTVCAKIDGGIPLSISSRRFAWVDPLNRVLEHTDVTTVPQTDLFLIPPRDPLGDDKRGLWRVNSISSRSSVRVSAFFNVSDAADEAANVLVYDLVNTDTADVASGSNVEFAMWIANKGPNAATDVEVSNTVGGGATFVQSVQDSGPAFTCTPAGGGTNCTISSLAAGASARIRVIYQVAGGATPGTIIANTATISSDTEDQNAENNSALAEIVVTDNSPGSACGILCPGNITKTANTTQNGQDGAIVTFGGAETSGDCGTVTAAPASGTFFPVGTTTVTLSASAGESCTFNVIVTDEPPPTIACPAGVSKDAGNDCSAEVTAAELGIPTTTGTGVTVAGQRSDGQELDAPYPVGTTTVVWTATDESNRTVSCNQTVTVTGTDTTPPTITAPPDITETTGAGSACGRIIGEGLLGSATTADNCSSVVNVKRTGVPAGNFFPVGETIITYTAKDGSGNTTTATQKVTITGTDTTPPVIAAPDDASYVCLSEVPAANPAQATRGMVLDGDGNPLPPAPPSDNCGVPAVTVSETSSGAGSVASPRIILRTFKATDASGNTASDTQTITVIDPTPPTIVTPANITVSLPLNSAATSMPVSYSTTGADNCEPPTITFSPASGSAFNVGTTTVTATATDTAGNTASTTFTVTVLYNFTGFFSPVGNLPTLNTVNAGRAIPVKFSLSGNKGLNIFAPNNPYSVAINCSTTDPAADITETLTAGGSSLSYSPDQYSYVWKTESSWAGTCRQLVVKLNDGSVHRANFKFK